MITKGNLSSEAESTVFMQKGQFQATQGTENLPYVGPSILNAILESSPDAIWAVDQDLQLMAFNEAFEKRMEALGQEEVQIGQYAILTFLPDEENQRWLDAYHRALTGTPQELISFIETEGSKTYYENRFHTIYDEKQKPLGILIQSRNITLDLQQKRELHQSSTQFQTLSKQISLGVFLADSDWNCTWVNTEMESIFERTSAELKGKGFLDRIHPDDVSIIEETMEYISREGQPHQSALKLYFPNNKIKYIIYNISPLTDARGNIYAYEGILEDKTERFQINHELDTFMELSLEMSCTANPEGYFQTLSDSWENIT